MRSGRLQRNNVAAIGPQNRTILGLRRPSAIAEGSPRMNATRAAKLPDWLGKYGNAGTALPYFATGKAVDQVVRLGGTGFIDLERLDPLPLP
jgi:hypothetical protein